MINGKAGEVIEKLFESFLSRYQVGLEGFDLIQINVT